MGLTHHDRHLDEEARPRDGRKEPAVNVPVVLLCCSWVDIGDCGSQRACSKTYLTRARPDPRCRLATQIRYLDRWPIVHVLGCLSRQIYCFLAPGKLTRRNFAVG